MIPKYKSKVEIGIYIKSSFFYNSLYNTIVELQEKTSQMLNNIL